MASDSETKKVEDEAYCLLGIMNVYLRLRYREGENALKRLKIKSGEQEMREKGLHPER